MKEQTRTYTHKCKNGTTAVITFSRPTDREIIENRFGLSNQLKNPDDWYFVKCEYQPNNTKYSIEDWEDLQELSTEILKLNKELTKYNGVSPVAFAK